MDVAIVNNGGANLASVAAAFERLGAAVGVTSDTDALRKAARIVLPGVGAAADGMQRLRQQRLVEPLRSLEQPVLGVCLGMQLLFSHSEEGDVDCLDIVPGRIGKMRAVAGERVPHMGWNSLEGVAPHPLLNGINDGDWFYFVHGFAAPLTDFTLATSSHGERFSAVVGRGNFCGVQFHPERSGEAGSRLLRNFLEWDGCS